MALVRFDEGPKLDDTVLIEIQTTDTDGITPLTPYLVRNLTIYYLERGVASSLGNRQFVDGDETVSYTTAVPVKTVGDYADPAWLTTDVAEAVIDQVTEDEDGNPLAGVFQYEWDTEFNREGDYFVCWTWEPIIAGSTISAFLRFYLKANTATTTSIPKEATIPGKYEKLMDRYVPDMYKNVLTNDDLSPDIIQRLNLAVAGAFTDVEDRANQILALQDSNALNEALLPYLANFFKWKLKTLDANLQRRQIKQAMPLYKQKGTLKGLTEAMAECGMSLMTITQYWQAVSKSTWQEGFRVENNGDTAFTLQKLPLAYDAANFDLQIMPAGSDAYTELDISNVSFSVVDGVGYMDWIGMFDLQKDDILKVIYKVKAVPDQSIENYIRTLPLMDNRSEAVMRDNNICFPKKNWNVRLIAADDPMLPVVCPSRHPYHSPVVFGKVRTEFPYSENIYNMEEYNGSLRDSFDPCDIDRDFVDTCPCCLSSSISLDVELQQLSNDRIQECLDLLREFLPFHARIYSINFNGSVEEYILPPGEEISTYMTNQQQDNVLTGQMGFNRTIQPWTENLKRDMLATADNLVTDTTGKGTNLAVTLYYAEQNFDSYTSGLDLNDNELEILSGLNSGTYSVTNPNKHVIDFADPTDVIHPFDPTRTPFRLSNIVYIGNGNIYQDDKFLFSDTTVNFTQYGIDLKKDTPANWKIAVTSGPYAGNYDIYDLLPDGSLVILGWPTSTLVSSINYDLYTAGSLLVTSSTAGKVTVQRRGRFETADNLVQQYLVQEGYWLQVSGTQYRINGILTDSHVYLDGYASGTQIGLSSIKILKRIIDNAVGYVGIRGICLSTVTNYYNTLQVSDQLEDDQHMENFLVLIGTDYYQISSWSNTPDGFGKYKIILNGTPVPEWGVSGVNNITFSIIQFLKTSPVTITTTFPDLIVETFDKLDRRGEEIIGNTVQTSMSAAMAAALLNAGNDGQNLDVTSQGERISYTIEYKD